MKSESFSFKVSMFLCCGTVRGRSVSLKWLLKESFLQFSYVFVHMCYFCVVFLCLLALGSKATA